MKKDLSRKLCIAHGMRNRKTILFHGYWKEEDLST